MSRFEDSFIFKIGDRVVVEVTGTVMVRQETQYGLKYIVQPDNPRAAAVHTSPEYVYADDPDEEPQSNVVPFPNTGEHDIDEVA
jgi:hypothetical protein